VTGFDIIFFWVARMIMFGLVGMEGVVPFHQVYIHGLVRDANGQKMSKSKGNILDPLDIIDGIDLEALVEKRTGNMMQPHLAEKIEKQTRKEFPDGIPSYGTDALRYTFASLASTGRDVRFDLKRVEGYRNFCNKLWNATRYVMMNVEGQDVGLDNDEYELSLADRWIISSLQRVEADVSEHLDGYRFDLAANAIYEFAWNEYCDWYVELAKPALQGDTSDAQKRGTRRTLVRVLSTILRLAHPLMPYITEELWQKVGPLAGSEHASIMVAPYPVSQPEKIDAEAEAEIDWIKQFVLGVRKIRAEMDIAPGKPLPVLVAPSDATDAQRAEDHGSLIKFLARVESIDILAAGDEAPESAPALIGDTQILIPMSGLIDKDAEVSRLQKEIAKLEAEIKRLSGKLNNEQFVAKAPEAVVAKERERLAETESSKQQLADQLAKIQSMD
ncbi:MAG: class I tRNA ligase family protein, partial [Pseudomonadota bacterium]